MPCNQTTFELCEAYKKNRSCVHYMNRCSVWHDKIQPVEFVQKQVQKLEEFMKDGFISILYPRNEHKDEWCATTSDDLWLMDVATAILTVVIRNGKFKIHVETHSQNVYEASIGMKTFPMDELCIFQILKYFTLGGGGYITCFREWSNHGARDLSEAQVIAETLNNSRFFPKFDIGERLTNDIVIRYRHRNRNNARMDTWTGTPQAFFKQLLQTH